jgi:hypothetical protein
VISQATTTENPVPEDLSPKLKKIWDAKSDFRGPEEYKLSPWEQYVQVLMCTNEFLFVD